MLNVDSSHSPSGDSGLSILGRHSSSSLNLINSKKKNRRSLINFSMDVNTPTVRTGTGSCLSEKESQNLKGSRHFSKHLTTIIPYNSEIEYTVQHLTILNKRKHHSSSSSAASKLMIVILFQVLKAINEDSHQVPELLTNYILKVVCPT